MPATYTYNDAIEAAKGVVARTWAEQEGDPGAHMKVMIEIVGRLEKLKRPTRRKRLKSGPSPELTAALNCLLPRPPS